MRKMRKKFIDEKEIHHIMCPTKQLKNDHEFVEYVRKVKWREGNLKSIICYDMRKMRETFFLEKETNQTPRGCAYADS